MLQIAPEEGCLLGKAEKKKSPKAKSRAKERKERLGWVRGVWGWESGGVGEWRSRGVGEWGGGVSSLQIALNRSKLYSSCIKHKVKVIKT